MGHISVALGAPFQITEMTLCVVSGSERTGFGAPFQAAPVSGRLDRRDIEEQNRDPVLYRINAAAFPALQAGRILSQNERLLTRRAHQNVEQILRNHSESF